MDLKSQRKIRHLFRFSRLGDIEDICKTFCEEVVEKYNRQQEHLEEINKKLQDLQAEAWKDETLQNMKTQLNEIKADYYRGFPISEKEEKAISNWKKAHDDLEHDNPSQYHGVSGGGYSYSFAPTAIGTSGVCYCSICKNRALNEASKNGEFDAEIYSKYLKDHNGSFEFQEIG